MDQYPGYREPPLARSPTERTNWGGRDEGYRDRASDRAEPRDNFYRGRSPGADRRRRDTRDRSRSPVAVDRYEPGRSRDDYDRERERNRESRRRPSPTPANIDRYIPGQDNGSPIIAKNPLKDPITLPVQVGYSLFSEWFKQNELIKEEKEFARSGKRKPISARETQEDRDREKAKVQAAYDNYKEEFQAKMARQFVTEHKKEQWFREKYVAEIRDPLRQELNKFRVGNYTQWETDLDAGIFDDYSLEGIPKSESNGAGGVIEKEEGETTGANEVLGVGDLVPLKGSDIRDENAFQPTLLIKTIAPHVSRQNLEAFCKENLGEGEGGFKWLSLSDPNPSKRYHRIGWVMLHPAPETAPVVERPEIKDADGEVIMAAEMSVPRSTADVALEAVNGKGVKDEEGGEFTVHFGVHNPPAQPRKKALWDLFSAPERVEKDLELARSLILKLESDFGSEFNAVLKIEERVEGLRSEGKIQPPVTAPKKTKKSREDRLDEAMESGEEGEEEEDEEEEGALDDEVDDEALLIKKKQLDLMVEYLRRVFNFCFFCVFESDSVHELTRKCAGGHLRRPRNTLSTAGKIAARASATGEPFPDKKRDTDDLDAGGMSPEAEKKNQRNNVVSKAEQQLQRAFNWVKTFESKITQILEPDNVDVRKLGGEVTEQAMNRELAKYVKQEDESKFRCRVPDQDCTKLFKGENFWKKHVEKRHPEWLDGLKEHFDLVNTYVLDPAHIAPSRSDANSNGHFPQPNGFAATGTPRGFNLQNYNGLGGMQSAAFGAGFPAFFANYPVQAPPLGWPAGSDRGGPVRRGGRTFQGSARTGPYDRRDGARWGENSGRLSPPPGSRPRGGMGGGGSRWGDGAAGREAVVPAQAVQGRVIKSYDDLDAVAGGGAGELNY